MSKKDVEQKIIENYRQDENMMVLVFAQWCVNNDLDPLEMYKKAYPNQEANLSLQKTLELTVSKEEAGEIADQTVLGVLSLFGNDDLAFVVSQEIEKRREK